MSTDEDIYGLMAAFSTPEEILTAAKRARSNGFHKLDAFTPFPVEGLAEIVEQNPSLVPIIVLICGISGGLGGYFMEWYATNISYPVNIGGRPLNSWPMYIPITFELTILSGAIAAIVGMLALNKLPEPHHPVFNVPGFDRATTDKFFLCIYADDPKFDPQKTRKFLEALFPQSIQEVKK